MVIWLAAYPRSGNTFFRHTCEQAYELQTYSIYKEPRIAGLRKDNAPFFELKEKPFGLCIVKTHGTEEAETEHPAIHLVRDGRAAIASYAFYRQTYDGATEPVEQLIEELIVSRDWANHTLMWLDRSAPRTTVYYEKLIFTPMATVRAALHKLDVYVPLCSEWNILSFDQLHKLDSKFYREGTMSSWHKYFTPRLNNLFWEKNGDAMNLIGYHKGST